MRAFCYCRVSTEEQSTDDHYSLDNQERKAKDYAKLKNWRILRTKKDVASGKDTNRSGFQELVQAVEAHEIDLVLVYRLDRLSRNVRDVYDVLDLMKQHDVGFVSITEGFDTTTAMGRAMLGVAAVFAQLTREMIAENVKDGLMRRAESGKWNGPKWNPPYGYRYVVGGTIEPETDEAEIIRRIFQWFAYDKWGTSKIARTLNLQGVRKDCGIRGSGQWRQAKVWQMLQNPVYIGLLTAGDRLVKGEHEAIVDGSTWELTRQMVAERKKCAPRTKASPHLLSGLVRCGKCKRALVAQFAKYKTNGGEKRFVGFRHPPNEFSGDKYCPGVYHRGDTLEEGVICAILELASRPDLKDMATAAVMNRLQDDTAPLKDESSRIQGRLAELEKLFDEWAERLDRHMIDEGQFQRHNTVLLEERQKLKARLAEVNLKLSEGERLEVSLAQVQEALRDVPAVWDSLEFEEKREIVKLLVERVEVHPDHVELHFHHLPVQELKTRRSGRQYQRRCKADTHAPAKEAEINA